MTKFHWTISGTAARGQTWDTMGTVEAEPGNFPEAVNAALRESFLQLTKGRAIFGRPGLGCTGPYTVKKLVIVAGDGTVGAAHDRAKPGEPQ